MSGSDPAEMARVLAIARASSESASATVIKISDFLARARATNASLRARARAHVEESDVPGEAASGPAPLLKQALEELSVGEEELRVADEQLRATNEELARAIHDKDREIARYREHFDLWPDGFAITDARGTVRQANATLAGLLHTSARFLDDKPLLHFVSRGDCAAFRMAVGDLVTTGEIHAVVIRLRPRQGGAVFAAD